MHRQNSTISTSTHKLLGGALTAILLFPVTLLANPFTVNWSSITTQSTLSALGLSAGVGNGTGTQVNFYLAGNSGAGVSGKITGTGTVNFTDPDESDPGETIKWTWNWQNQITVTGGSINFQVVYGGVNLFGATGKTFTSGGVGQFNGSTQTQASGTSVTFTVTFTNAQWTFNSGKPTPATLSVADADD
jgi:hypothetical protein